MKAIHHLHPAYPRLAGPFALALLLTAATPSRAGELPKNTYETGFPSMTAIGANLHTALDAKRRQQLQSRPVLLDAVATPCVAPGRGSDGGAEAQTVEISAGAVQFLNQLAHAKAIEESEKGYLKTYVAALSQAASNQPLASLPSTSGLNPWDADTLNYQVGNFNQMAGALMAIEMAHHYLGHAKKYSAQLAPADGAPPVINAVITEKEWREAVLKGAKNALDCGYGVDGLRCVFECLGQMPNRPAWAAYFIHAKADLSKINRDLVKLEKDFFLVGK